MPAGCHLFGTHTFWAYRHMVSYADPYVLTTHVSVATPLPWVRFTGSLSRVLQNLGRLESQTLQSFCLGCGLLLPIVSPHCITLTISEDGGVAPLPFIYPSRICASLLALLLPTARLTASIDESNKRAARTGVRKTAITWRPHCGKRSATAHESPLAGSNIRVLDSPGVLAS